MHKKDKLEQWLILLDEGHREHREGAERHEKYFIAVALCVKHLCGSLCHLQHPADREKFF